MCQWLLSMLHYSVTRPKSGNLIGSHYLWLKHVSGRNSVHLLNGHVFNRWAAESSFICGRSTANQRIECFWSMLRKKHCQFWMSYFRQLKEDGMYTGSEIDKELIRFCFLPVIQVCLKPGTGFYHISLCVTFYENHQPLCTSTITHYSSSMMKPTMVS